MVNLDDIKSNNIKRCVDCGIPITPDNDSGWEVFVDAVTTQPVCAWCDVIRSQTIPEKADEDNETKSD